MSGLSGVNICELLWTGYVMRHVEGAGMPGAHPGGVLDPLEKSHTPIHMNVKITQNSSFVNNLIGISTRVGGTSIWTR